MMSPSNSKLPVSAMAIIICSVGFACFLYVEDISLHAGTSVFKLTHCSRDDQLTNSHGKKQGTVTKEKQKLEAEKEQNFSHGNRISSVSGCNFAEGNWVFNRSIKPLYSESSCTYLEQRAMCERNGRPNTDYKYWHWQPDSCDLPRFDAHVVLERLKGKRMMFVGDSLLIGMWASFICSVESHIPEGEKSLVHHGPNLSIFTAKKYNATMEFYWAPFLVESNSDQPIIPDPRKRILKLDSIYKHAKHWINTDILIFDTYVWWMNGYPIKSLWGSFKNGLEGYEELDTPTAYRIGLKTWANWVDSTVDPNRTRVFFTTMSPTHLRSADWNNPNGIKCYNETSPVLRKGYWGTGSDRRIMAVVKDIVERMKIPVTLINITQLSEHRKDGHTSVYTEFEGKMITEEQRAEPRKYADCIHWCLPGVPDTWNQIFYAYL